MNFWEHWDKNWKLCEKILEREEESWTLFGKLIGILAVVACLILIIILVRNPSTVTPVIPMVVNFSHL